MKVVHVIDSLAYSGAARQLQLLGTADPSMQICCLGRDTPWSDSLQRAGATVYTLGWSRWFDVGALLSLREILHDADPDVIHVWRRPTLRVLALVAPKFLERVVMSSPLPTRGKLAWWDRALLRRVRCLAASGPSDGIRCVHECLGVPVQVVPPAVELVDRSEKRPDTFSIACVGNFERDEGTRNAIWAFDIVRQLHTETRLRLVGAGSQLEALLDLTSGLQNTSVDFLGEQPDVADALGGAGVVWIPSVANCGRQVALEAMAHGRPVIASDVPCLRDVIRDGETGFLVPPGDVVALARRTHALHQDIALRQRIGAAARQYVARHHALADVIEKWHALYRQCTADVRVPALAA